MIDKEIHEKFTAAVDASDGLSVPAGVEELMVANLLRLVKDHDEVCDESNALTDQAVTDARTMVNTRAIAILLARVDELERRQR